MDIEKLKENIRNLEYDLEYGEEQNQGRVAVNVNCLRSVIDFSNEAIARQSVTDEVVCPNCGGSGVYQEYDEYDRYYVYACHECEGTGEIARQSVKREEVQRAIEQLKYAREQDREFDDGTFVDSLDLAIAALQAYQPKG